MQQYLTAKQRNQQNQTTKTTEPDKKVNKKNRKDTKMIIITSQHKYKYKLKLKKVFKSLIENKLLSNVYNST